MDSYRQGDLDIFTGHFQIKGNVIILPAQQYQAYTITIPITSVKETEITIGRDYGYVKVYRKNGERNNFHHFFLCICLKLTTVLIKYNELKIRKIPVSFPPEADKPAKVSVAELSFLSFHVGANKFALKRGRINPPLRGN